MLRRRFAGSVSVRVSCVMAATRGINRGSMTCGKRLLPRLSTYLGHINIQETQCYLILTPELLREVSCGWVFTQAVFNSR
jgi:hypothetical protein